MGLIGTRSLTEEMPGIVDLIGLGRERSEKGIIAFDALTEIRAARGHADPAVKAQFEEISFSGFHLVMFIVLAALILRPVAFTYRSKSEGPK